MKKYFVCLLLLLIVLSCKNSSDKDLLSYKNVYGLSIEDLDKKRALLSAEITFANKSESKDYKLKEVNIDIIVDGIDMGTYYSRDIMDFRSQSQLKVPMKHGLDQGKLIGQKEKLPTSFVVQVKGKASFVDIHGKVVSVSIEHKETVRPATTRRQKRREKRKERRMMKQERKTVNEKGSNQ